MAIVAHHNHKLEFANGTHPFSGLADPGTPKKLRAPCSGHIARKRDVCATPKDGFSKHLANSASILQKPPADGLKKCSDDETMPHRV